MSTTNEIYKNTIVVGDGIVTVIPLEFSLPNTERYSLKVLMFEGVTSIETVLVETTDYTLGVGDITLVTPLAVGFNLYIERISQTIQPLDYMEQEPFPAEVTEALMDRAFLALSEMKGNLARAFTAGPFSGVTSFLIPAPEEGKGLIWDDGGALTNADLIGVGDLSVLQEDIATNAGDILSNAGDIAIVVAEVATNTGDIATNTAAIPVNISDLGDVNTAGGSLGDSLVLDGSGNWVPGSGGVPSVNVPGCIDLVNPRFEADIVGWALLIGTLTPAGGANVGTAIARNTVDPLGGSGDLQMTLNAYSSSQPGDDSPALVNFDRVKTNLPALTNNIERDSILEASIDLHFIQINTVDTDVNLLFELYDEDTATSLGITNLDGTTPDFTTIPNTRLQKINETYVNGERAKVNVSFPMVAEASVNYSLRVYGFTQNTSAFSSGAPGQVIRIDNVVLKTVPKRVVGNSGRAKQQKKGLAADLITTGSDIVSAELSLNNLTIGKSYGIKSFIVFRSASGSASGGVVIMENGAGNRVIEHKASGNGVAGISDTGLNGYEEFIAKSTSLIFTYNINVNMSILSNAYVILTELPYDLIATEDFT